MHILLPYYMSARVRETGKFIFVTQKQMHVKHNQQAETFDTPRPIRWVTFETVHGRWDGLPFEAVQGIFKYS